VIESVSCGDKEWVVSLTVSEGRALNFGQIVESTDSGAMRYYLVQITDAGSIPDSATKLT
jgi:hypothetical protein